MQYPSQVEFDDVADFETILEASWVTERESPRKESLALYLTAPFFYQILSLFWAKLEAAPVPFHVPWPPGAANKPA